VHITGPIGSLGTNQLHGGMELNDGDLNDFTALPARTPGLLLVVTASVAVVGLALAALQQSDLSFVAYWCVLIMGTGLVAYHRWIEAQRSSRPDHVIPPRWKRRLQGLPVLLVLLACAANAYVWATEVAKR
jgi:hypothetical protein